jgi:O-antigen/teichoic acid export membrane protein
VAHLETPASPPGGDPEPLGGDEVRARAASGAALLGGRGALIYAVGIGANLLLARLLVPEDFGLVTLGTVVLSVGLYVGEAGAGAALIRREPGPSRAELRAVNALQLAIAVAVLLVCVAAAGAIGRDGWVVATMVASLPVWVLRAPSVIVLERELRYRAIATADVLSALSYYAWAIATVALGLGVWGLATAVVVRAVAGTATMVALGPVGLLGPRWSWPLVRPLIGFAAKFQASALLHIGREQALNVGVALVAGIATLGVWNLAWRILQVPNLLFTTVGRVAYPAMARLLGGGEDPRPVIERSIAVIATLTGVVSVALVGFAPALPVLVGPGWEDVPATLLWSGIALIVGSPVVAGTVGYLLASDQAGSVATGTLAMSVVWLAVGLPLLPSIGPPAMGIAWVAAGVVNSALLWRRTAARTGAAIGVHVAGPVATGLLGAAAGWLVAVWLGRTLPAGAAGIAVGELVLLAGLALVGRSALRQTRSLVARGLGSLREGGQPSRSPA